MLRRALPPEPYAVSADWSRRTAVFSALLASIAIPVSRSGVVGGLGGVAILAVALGVAVLAILLAARAALVIWRTGRRGTGRALAGLTLAILILAYPAYAWIEAAGRPQITDASTDLSVPPPFSSSAAARAGRGAVVHTDPAAAAREAQRTAYPALHPGLLDATPEEALRLVLKLLSARRWPVVEANLPKGKLGTGHVDALVRSAVLGLPADVALRIRPEGGQTRVDMRIASRLPGYDTSDNAARIESFIDDLENAE